MKKIFLLTGLLALLTSCSDLEEDTSGIIVEPGAFFQGTENLQSSVNAAYSFAASEEFWGRKLTLSLLLRGDMVTIGDPTTSQRRIEVDQFSVDPSSGMVSAFWPRSFNIIAAANNAIEGRELVTGSQEDLDKLEGEARFIRAFTYYHLVRLFGEVPYINSVPNGPEELQNITKSSVESIYTEIINDLKLAKDLLPQTNSFRSRPSSGAASAYLASVYLTLGDFENAYTEAKSIIDNKGSFGYELATDFQSLFDASAQDAPEKIFAIEYVGQDVASGNIGQDFLAPITGLRGFPGQSGWSVAVPSVEVFDSFNDNDYRKEVSFIASYDVTEPDAEGVPQTTTIPWQNFEVANRAVNRPHIAKYFLFPGTAGANNRDSSHNYIAMRYAEVLLIAAEAANELFGPTDESMGYINELRARARNGATGSAPSTTPEDVSSNLSQDSFREIVLEERRIELAFEFKRWYDIKRLDSGVEVFGADGLDPQPNFDFTRDYLFPLPGDELARVPSLLPQNTGY